MDIRRFGSQYRSPAYTHARIRETYETYYDIRYPNHERQAGRPLRVTAANAWHAEHDAAFGEKSGWERVNWYESNAAGGDEKLRPRGWAGQHWSPAIGAEHLATREGVAVFDESSFAKLEIAGPGAAGHGRAAVRQPGRARAGQDHLHPDAEQPRRHRVRLHRDPPRRRALLDRDRDGLRKPRSRVDSQAPGSGRGIGWRRQRPGPRRHLAVGLLRRLGPEGPRRPAAAHPPGPRQRGLPLHERPRDHRRQRAGAGAAGHLRRRARMGALLPDGVRARPVAGAVGGGRAARDRRGAATARSTRCGSRRAIWSGGPTSLPTRPPTRPASASRSSSTRRAASSAARRWSRRRSRGPASAWSRSCSRTRARSRSATSRSESGARSAGGSPPAATAIRSSARSPTPTCRRIRPSRATRSRSRSSAAGSPARSPKGPCSTPAGERIRA